MSSVRLSRRTKWLLSTAVVAFLGWYGLLLVNLARPTVSRIIVSINPSAADPTELEPNTVFYPNVGIRAPLRLLTNTSPLVVQDWPSLRSSLNAGTALVVNTPDWQSSTFSFLVGHSSDTRLHTYSSVFAPLRGAALNDLLYINVDGVTYTYQVDSREVASPTDQAYWEALIHPPTSDLRRLALVTCWPILTTRDRLVVTAHELK